MKIETLNEMLLRTDTKKTVNKQILSRGVYYYAPLVTVPSTPPTPDSAMAADGSGV